MKNSLYPEQHILSIDLKSFFASCECVMRNLDPFNYPLVVANPYQGNGAITLAVTPYLKKQGVKSRGRLYEIPKNVKYEIAPPRMNSYVAFSEKVISIYLDFVAKEDIHVYSIDECFLDVTHYLKLYKKSDYELAEEILQEITKRTGLTATCGIGPNILLAKIAMDTEAKLYKNGIAKWSYDDVKNKLWKISPLSKMWGIGLNLEKRLNKLGIMSVGDLANYNKNILKDRLGVIGVELWEHANGIDLSKISEMNNHKPMDKSFSNSQVLFRDYYANDIDIIIQETVDVVTKRLRKANKLTSVIGIAIGYSKKVGGGFYHVVKTEAPTDNIKLILNYSKLLFDKYYDGSPIRKIGISLGRLSDKDSIQLDIFNNYEDVKKEDNKNKAIDEIVERFGKNSLLKASALLPNSTIIDRNQKLGGHKA